MSKACSIRDEYYRLQFLLTVISEKYCVQRIVTQPYKFKKRKNCLIMSRKYLQIAEWNVDFGKKRANMVYERRAI